MIGGGWKRPERDRQSPLLVRLRLYCTPVGVIPGLILFRLVAFWGRSTMGWSVPFSLGEFLVEGPLLPPGAYRATGPLNETSRPLTDANSTWGDRQVADPKETSNLRVTPLSAGI
jgi:hypothetical protein